MKLKEKTKKQIRGSVTILLVIILLPMMTFSAIIVDMSRINMAKEMMASAGDLAMNTELANYDTILKDVYGLFAMSQNEEELEANVKEYFERTLVSYNVIEEANAGKYVDALLGDFHELLSATSDIEATDFLRLQNVTAESEGIPSSSLANADILRKQVVEYMKYRAPLEFGMSFLDALKSFDTVDDQTEVVEYQVKAQESTQDVTEACSKLIELIREYDDLVKAIDEGDQAVTGEQNISDGKIVPLEDYDTQVDRYRESWDDNYKHINKINLIFLDNNPNVDNVYLKNLDYAGGVYYIADEGRSLVHSNSGISFTVEGLAGDVSAAMGQVNNQIALLNGTYLSFANNYINRNFISAEYLGENKFTDENSAITTFSAFEAFLLNQADIKYDDPNGTLDVKGTLDEIYKLEKYYQNFKTLKQPEIDAARSEMQTAEFELGQAKNQRTDKATRLKSCVHNINQIVSNTYSDLNDKNTLDFLDDSLRSDIIGIFASLSDPVEPNYRSYYDTNFAYNGTNKYDYYFDWIVTNSDQKSTSVAKAAKAYTGSAEDFPSYMASKEGITVYGDDLYKLLNVLIRCSMHAENFNNLITEYNNANTLVSQKQEVFKSKKAIYDQKVDELNAVRDNMANCLKGFIEFVKSYQEDAYNFGRYIDTARAIVENESTSVWLQFSAILNNVDALQTKLAEISDQITVVKKAIEVYNQNLDNWEENNNAYIADNGKDSFSEQEASDIATARSEYDADLFTTLEEFVIAIYSNYNDFYNYLTDATHFKYGKTKINQILSADAVIDAVSGLRGDQSIVTADLAEAKFLDLYSRDLTPMFVPYTVESENPAIPHQLCFLEPTVVQIQILKYLNSAYPEGEKLTDKQKQDNKTQEENYYEAKDELISESGGSASDTSDAVKDAEGNSASNNDFGYTYKSKNTISTSGLPSSGAGQKTVTDTQYKLKDGSAEEDDETVDASSGMSEQKEILNTVLKGIGNAATAGLENAYILTYIFENFSYNTMVQDAMVEADAAKPAGERIVKEGNSLATALSLMNNAEALAAVKDKSTMLSGYYKNANNNYLYGAEIEYILYGNTNPSKNVTYTKASIYAIRFGFNCIYAFTNSEIRNSTMAAGLAVQAATLGIVPYQVVQIVLQLALAAAESALDLEMMNCGMKVAVVKTSDTWLLSITNGVQTATSIVADMTADVVHDTINDLTTGLQDIVDAGADKLNDAIGNVSESLLVATEKAMTDVVDQAFGHVTKAIEEKLNELLYITESTTADVTAKVDEVFAGLDVTLQQELEEMFAGNELAQEVLPLVTPQITLMIEHVKSTIIDKLNNMTSEANGEIQDAGDYLISQISDIKKSMIEYATSSVKMVTGNIESKATAFVSEVQGEINSYIGETGQELSEEAAETVRDAVTEAANSYIDKYLGGGAGIGSGSSTGANSSVAAAIKFGYKDYLMLFTYLAICVNDENILLRTADLIQLNVTNAGEGAEFKHSQAENFKMSSAYTYVSLKATAELDLMLMDLDIFADMVKEEEPQADAEAKDDGPTFKIEYKGLAGY